MTFHDTGLAEPLLRAIASDGYTTPTPIQTAAIPHVLAGRDLLGCAQTGTGKTAAFALPTLHRLAATMNPPQGRGRHVRALVLSPTRELAGQIHESFRGYGRHTPLRSTVIFGGVSQRPQVRDLEHGVDVVVATPGRLVDLIQQGFVDLARVEIFILDEADRMFDMGFLPDVKRIVARLPRQRQTLFFSATMPGPIEALAGEMLVDPVRVRIAPERQTTDLIDQSVCFVTKANKPRLLIDLMSTQAISRAIVFTRTKHGADKVAKQLGAAGIRAEAMHGNKSQNARQRTLDAFKSKRPPVLVATDLAARGIDVDGISHVFNFDLPHEPETYVHRIGRTGRAGATGRTIAFCDRDERKLLTAIERLLRQSIEVDDHEYHDTPPSGEPPAGSSRESKRRPPRRRQTSVEPAPHATGHPVGPTARRRFGKRPGRTQAGGSRSDRRL
jgi:ATP-dependent RNA helicase RhlE